MRIAIVGSGISGLVCAHLLHPDHDIVVYEKNDYAGGHTHTVDVALHGRSYAVDTGFIVCNEWTYPNFLALLRELDVALQPTSMSFSVRNDRAGIEYNGTSLNTLFAQRSNLFRPSFHRMIRDILRFNRHAPSVLDDPDPSLTLGEYLDREEYSEQFRENYILPMGAAVWSSPRTSILGFPAVFFIRFFKNHGMLSVNDRPQWYTVSGGSRTYVERLTRPFLERIRLSCPVTAIRRSEDRVRIEAEGFDADEFDEVILATHSDEALSLLADASDEEREILGSLCYQPNATVLHTDTTILPRRKAAWASWNYHIPDQPQPAVTVTYDMNILQALQSRDTFLVTLNESDLLDPEQILGQFDYAHPQFDAGAYEAQQRWAEIDGRRRTHFCGAYWRYGFHEDGVVSALRVCEAYGKRLNGG